MGHSEVAKETMIAESLSEDIEVFSSLSGFENCFPGFP